MSAWTAVSGTLEEGLMWTDLLVGGLFVLGLILFPIVVLFLSKIAGYGIEAGRHKFLNRRKNRGS